jgi:hypothetical protein
VDTMRDPLTADERERRLVEYLQTLNKGQLAEFKLSRLGKLSNQRKRLIELFNEIVETRAEDLAAGMLMEFAQKRPVVTEKPAVMPSRRKRGKPVWVVMEGNAARGVSTSK